MVRTQRAVRTPLPGAEVLGPLPAPCHPKRSDPRNSLPLNDHPWRHFQLTFGQLEHQVCIFMVSDPPIAQHVVLTQDVIHVVLIGRIKRVAGLVDDAELFLVQVPITIDIKGIELLPELSLAQEVPRHETGVHVHRCLLQAGVQGLRGSSGVNVGLVQQAGRQPADFGMLLGLHRVGAAQVDIGGLQLPQTHPHHWAFVSQPLHREYRARGQHNLIRVWGGRILLQLIAFEAVNLEYDRLRPAKGTEGSPFKANGVLWISGCEGKASPSEGGGSGVLVQTLLGHEHASIDQPLVRLRLSQTLQQQPEVGHDGHHGSVCI
mmetsp:Transcript_65031/g.115745  ORF Transcript_65031/g.115745 Transcript_65031/m.115745 type:complete len:319 (+) Transcript_65031:1182-2138(+)